MNLVTFDLNNLREIHFLECRQGRYFLAKATEQVLANNFAFSLWPPLSDFVAASLKITTSLCLG